MGSDWSSENPDDSALAARFTAIYKAMIRGGRMLEERYRELRELEALRDGDRTFRFLVEAQLDKFEQDAVNATPVPKYRRKHENESFEEFFFVQLKHLRDYEPHTCPMCGAHLLGEASWQIHIVHAHHPTHPLRRKDVGPWTRERAMFYCQRYDGLGKAEKRGLAVALAERRKRDLLLGYREQLLSDGLQVAANNGPVGERVRRLIDGAPDALTQTLALQDVLACNSQELQDDMLQLLSKLQERGVVSSLWRVFEGVPTRNDLSAAFSVLSKEYYVMTARAGKYRHSMQCYLVREGIPTLLTVAVHKYDRACEVCGGQPFKLSELMN